MGTQEMKKLLALAVAGAFIGATSMTTFAPAAFAAETKAKASACEKIKDEKKHAACMKKEAAKAAKAAKKDMKK